MASSVPTSAHEKPHVDTTPALAAASFGATPAASVAHSQLCAEAVLSDRSAWLTRWWPRAPRRPRVTSSAMQSRRLCGIGAPKPGSAARAASGRCSHANAGVSGLKPAATARPAGPSATVDPSFAQVAAPHQQQRCRRRRSRGCITPQGVTPTRWPLRTRSGGVVLAAIEVLAAVRHQQSARHPCAFALSPDRVRAGRLLVPLPRASTASRTVLL